MSFGDFEVHPVGTGDRLRQLSARLRLYPPLPLRTLVALLLLAFSAGVAMGTLA